MLCHREGQAAFAAAIRQPTAPADLAALGITATGDLERRFSVYRNTFASSLIAALAARFPTVAQLVGADFFRALARAYLADHPPATPVLLRYGAGFPDFLAAFAPVAGLPYLPDVARIDVLRGIAYHAADAVPLCATEVHDAMRVSPETARLTLHPSLAVLQTGAPAVSIWRRNQSAAQGSVTASGPEAALIFRHTDDAVVLPVAPDAAHVVAELAAGEPLGGVVASETAITTALAILLRYSLITHVHQTQPGSKE